ncbi:hypothetical protein [Marinimicrobium sp. ABcell2]|uniref:secretion/conjugation apparatus DotM-related subunit n=1 Tax=Marinimicrobium sp. ABcell2 TaxID=3069751 RepID=UPI0027AE03CC|nr:hypothetical protein [Marinimicrobium sp. ABcell2]MDQ2077535.1 hypothetical protein [Marinimicrobium sp. ABcell2]
MSDSDLREKNFDPIGMLIILLVLLAGAYFGFRWFWSNYDSTVKDIFLWTAYYLRYIQLPFSPVMTETYKTVLWNLPNLYNEYIGTNYDDEFLPVFAQIAMRNVAMHLAVIFIPFGIYLISRHDKLMFVRQMGVDQLIEVQRKFFPRIRPATNQNLLHKDPRFGNWASAQNPIEMAIQRGFMRLEDPENIPEGELREVFGDKLQDIAMAGLKDPTEYTKVIQGVSAREYAELLWPTANAQPESDPLKTLYDNIDLYHGLLHFDVDRLKEHYTATLGPRCQYGGKFIDIRPLPPYERTLWVLFMACISQNKDLRKRVETMLDQLSASFEEGPFNAFQDSIDLTGVDEIYALAIKSPKVRSQLARISRSHAYYYTAFFDLYVTAKKFYGTIKCTDFHWLRVTNRLLFLALDSVGMDRVRFEAAAIKSHYLAERKRRYGRGMRILAPQVESAVLNTIYELQFDGWLAIELTDIDEDAESPTFMQARWKSTSTVETSTEPNAPEAEPA